MSYLWAFLIGGIICALAQILIDKTKMTPARILVLCVVLGVVLGGFGIYKYLVDFAKAGATVPLLGFGYSLAKGTKKAIDEIGFLGIFTGGVTATSAGIASVTFFGYILALIFKPKSKSK